MESDQSEGQSSRNVGISRAGTMSEGANTYRKDNSKIFARPKSEIPLGVGNRELETSFEVSQGFRCLNHLIV